MNISPEKFRFSFVRNGQTTYCLYGPEEWNDNSIKWNRDKRTHGVLTKYADTFSFVMEDADYLRRCFEEQQVFAKVRFTAERYNSETFCYEPCYSADVDFYSYEEDPYMVKITLCEMGYKVTFDANYDTTYEIPPGNTSVNYDRLLLKNEIVIGCGCNTDLLEGWATVFNTYEIKSTVYVNKMIGKSVEAARRNGDNWIFKATQDVDLYISFNLSGTFWPAIQPGEAGWGIIMKAYRDNIPQIIYEYHHDTEEPETRNIGKLEPYRIILKAGQTLYFTVEATGANEGIRCNGTITLSYSSRNHEKTIPGLRPAELLTHLVEKATGGLYSNIDTTALSAGEIGNMLITSGDLIRGIKGGKIKTSLKDFFEAMQALFGLAFTFCTEDNREKLVVRHINDMFRKDQLLAAVDDIRDLRINVANDYIYNKVKAGYKNKTYDEVNGKFEFNTEVQFAVTTEAKSTELKLVSPYRADMYGIEFLIIGYESEDSKDSKDDNDVFVFHTKKSGSSWIPNRDYRLLNGETSAKDTVFNVYLSPRNCLMRQEEYLRSMFMFAGSKLQFASSTREFEAITSNGDGNGGEHQDIDLTEGEALYKPIVYEFETMIPVNIAELVRDRYNGFVEATDSKRTIRGFLLALSENPGRNKSQTWKLLAMADQ